MLRKLIAAGLMTAAVALTVAGLKAELEPPRSGTLLVPTDPKCDLYANNAIHDYWVMKRHPKCHLPDSPRWQPNYANHYGWCVKAPVAARVSEAKARSAHLAHCGGEVPID